MARNRIFISYSHKDEKLFQEFLVHLKPWEDILDVWTDKRLEAGQDWHSEIQQGVASAAVAVLLISPDFMASDYIRQHEIPFLLQVAETRELCLAPLYLRSSVMDKNHPLSRYQGLNSPDLTPASKPKGRRDRIFASAAQQLRQLIKGSISSDPPVPSASQSGLVPITPTLPPKPPLCAGRDDLIVELVQHLMSERPPPVPILGAAAIGKSNLTLTALHHSKVAARFGERRFFVRCDGATTRSMLVTQIAQTLGNPALAAPP